MLYLPFVLAALPAVHAQLNDLAVKAGMKYFGSETDNRLVYSHPDRSSGTGQILEIPDAHIRNVD